MSTPRKNAPGKTTSRKTATRKTTSRKTTSRKTAPVKSVRSADPAASDVVLSGPPGRLRATLSVANTGDRSLPIEAVRVRLADRTEVAGTANAVIAPHESGRVPVLVSLAPGMAPGAYAAEVELAGVTRPAMLWVEPRPALDVSPGTVMAVPGTQDVTLTLTNSGNVPLVLAAHTRARTDDGGPDPGPDVSLHLSDPPTVEPGQRLVVAGALEVPELDPTRRHTARVPIGLTDIAVHVLPRTTKETS